MMKHASALAAAALLCGCASYTPPDLSAMSTGDLCYLEYMQRPNLSAQGRQAIESELQSRKDDCRSHAAEVAQRFDDFMWQQTYLIQDP